MRMMNIARGLFGSGMVALALGFALGGAGVAGAAPRAAAAGTAYVRVVHAAPAAPDVDVYVDNSKLLTDFKFGTVTDYVPLAAGSHEIDVTPTGKDVSAAVIKQQVSVNDGANYTVAAIGDTKTTPALTAFVDDNSVVQGKARVRVYHLSSDAGPVSVATGGSTVIPDLQFKNASDYLNVAPGAYTFDVALKSANNKTVSTSATLVAHQVTSVFALGLVNGSGDTAFKFAAKTVPGVPTGLPQTGNNPNAAQLPMPAPYAALLGLGALLIAGGSGVALARRRAR